MAKKGKVKVVDMGWIRMQREFARAGMMSVAIGVHDDVGDQIHPESLDATIAEVATFAEFGTATSPARPWLTQGIAAADPKKLEQQIATDIFNGKLAVDAMTRAGKIAEKIVIKTFGDGVAPIQAATAAAKGSSKPLIDTGILRASISFKIVNPNDTE